MSQQPPAQRRGAWLAAASWVLVPFVAGSASSQALDGRSTAVMVVASALGWGLWSAALVATLVPRTISLTLYRTIAPLAVVAAVWAATSGAGPVAATVAVVGAVGAVVVAYLASTGDAFVDGSSYGPERRLALRVPAKLLLGPLELAWLLAAAGAVTGPLLLAARQWALGGAALVVGWPLARAAVRRLHVLSRRWVVFVPAGLVVHDPLALADAALFARRNITAVRPAAVDNPGIDLTLDALGLAIEIAFDEPQEVSVRRDRSRPADTVAVPSVLCTPTRPAHFLDAARANRLPTPN